MQAFQAHRLGQVVGGFQLKGLQSMLGMCRHKHNGRGLRHVAQGLGQFQTVGTGHVDVQQRQVHGRAA